MSASRFKGNAAKHWLPCRLFAWASATIMLSASMQVRGADTSTSTQVAFTPAQSELGSATYRTHCAVCHGADLQNGTSAALTGSGFMNIWGDGRKTVSDLQFVIRNTMPLAAPRSLSDAEYTNVVAFILSRNGYAPGDIALSPPTADTLIRQAGQPVERAALPAPPSEVHNATTNAPDDADLLRADDATWLLYNRTLTGERYSGLKQINAANAKNLRVVCLFQAGEIGTFEASPVVYANMLYVTTAYNTFALDPTNCKSRWEHRYDPNVSVPVLVSRGVSIYRGKVFRVTPSGHLLALDARTGELLWDVWVSDVANGSWLSAAPIAYDGKVYIGTAGADWGANGRVYAFDAETGRRVWTFNDIPTGNEKGAETWKNGSRHGGGATWSTYTLDPATGLLLVAIGNPSPAFNGAIRPGDNLYTNSVVALDHSTGKLIWYVQQIPHDTHDWDTVAAPVLYDQGGRHYMAVPNKGGWVYIYDRSTHKLLSRTEVSHHENENVPLSAAGIHYCPGIVGGVLWNGTAYSADEKVLYVNSLDWCGVGRIGEGRFIEGKAYFDGDFTLDPISTARGWTKALDAATGKEMWSRPSHSPMLAALTPTGGGVVFTGDLDGNFLALDAKSGATLYSFNTGGGVAGAASTYLIDGRQYVAVTSGNSSRMFWKTTGSAVVVVFALDAQ